MLRSNSASSSHAFMFAKFCIVGAITATIYFLAMWVVYTVLSLNYFAAVSIAFFASTLFHYLANRHFTFGAVIERHGKQAIRYLGMLIFNYLITISVVIVCVERFLLSPYVGVWISLVFTTLTGYVLARYWIFNILMVEKCKKP